MTIRSDATRQRIPTLEVRKLRAVVSRQGQVLLDTDFEDLAKHTIDRFETGEADFIGTRGRLAVPAMASGFAVSAVSLPGGKVDCTVSAGRGYLDGWLVENPAAFQLSATAMPNAQPHPFTRPAGALPAIVGLKAVVRLIDPVEEPALADRALGDAQASGRSIVDWQVFTFSVPGPTPLLCADILALAEWQDLARPSTGTLTFIKAASTPSNDPCSLIESGGYTRLENLLYRVEVHRGELGAGAPDIKVDGPRYKLDKLQLKLSRCNASVMARITKVAGKVFTVAPAALDPSHWFTEGQLAELVSIHDDVDTASGHETERLFRVARVSDDEVELIDRSAIETVASVKAAADGTWFLRMWDSLPGGGEVATVKLDASGTKSTVIELGDGISIQLSGDAAARFRRGDFWTCAMRADGEIEWVAGQFETPSGPERRYAPLAVVNSATAVEDCRIAIASLSDRTLLYRGGDGQEAKPDPTKPTQTVPLASPLSVAVMRGEQLVVGAKVHFEISGLPAGKTALLTWQPPSGPAQSGTILDVVTGTDGRAEVAWAIDPTVSNQFVKARLVEATGMPAQPPITFTANLSLAADTGFDPKTIPVFTGITDVQRALEALAGMQQSGCATYVLAPDNWLAVLGALKPGEDAKLCFQRGKFGTKTKVVLSGLGHITMCGAGEATQIVVETGECALEFNGCKSVHVSEVAVDAPHGMVKDLRGPVVPGRGGTLTVLNCPEVHISDATFACGGQALTERTCITARGNEKVPLRSVRIVDNRIICGFAQDGILVTDAERCVIEGNEVRAADLPAKFDYTRVLLSRNFQKVLLRAIVPDGPITPAPAVTISPNLRLIRIGRLAALFESPIPQEEWDRLVAAAPLGRDVGEADAKAYVERLFAVAATNTGLVERFAGDVRRIERVNRHALDPEVRAALLRTGDIEILPFAEARRRLEEAGHTRSDGLPKFSSVMNEDNWMELLRLAPLGAGGNAKDTGEHLRKLARMALADAKLRSRLTSLHKWFKTRLDSFAPFARQGITCGGRVLGDVVIARNFVHGFAQAVHIGTSFEVSGADVAAGSVEVFGNIGRLETLGDLSYSPAGIFIGNANSTRVADNQLGQARLGGGGFAMIGDGIRLWGYFGRFIAIEKNLVGVGNTAIHIKSLRRLTDADIRGLMWLVADNLGETHTPANVLKVPAFVERRYNRP